MKLHIKHIIGALLISLACTVNGQTLIAQGETRERIEAVVAQNQPYSQDRVDANGYRLDCSGQASYVCGLPTGLTTSTIPNFCDQVSPTELRAGDLLNNLRAKTSFRHVVVFLRWANSDRTKYVGFEMAGGYAKRSENGPRVRTLPYPYYSTRDPQGYVPLRPKNQVGLIKSPFSDTVWAVIYGSRYAFQSFESFQDWKCRVEDIWTVPEPALVQVRWGGPLPHLVKNASSSSVYWARPSYVAGSQVEITKRPIHTWEVFLGMGFRGEFIRVVSDARLSSYRLGSLITSVEPRFVAVAPDYFIPDGYSFGRGENLRAGMAFYNAALTGYSSDYDARAAMSFWYPNKQPGNFEVTGRLNLQGGQGTVHWTGFTSFADPGRYYVRPAMIINGTWYAMEVAIDPTFSSSRPMYFDIR